jgi:hypothetical protein
MPVEGGDGLASVAETLAGLTAAARAGGLDDTAALTALAAARRIAAELEDSELALIEAARDGGATWTRIAAALGVRNRQTAQKRHADRARRCPRPPSVDTPGSTTRTAGPGRQVRRQQPPRSKSAGERGRSSEEHDPGGRPCQAAASARAARHGQEAAGHPEDHRRHHRRGPLRARPGLRPRRDPCLARPGRRQARGTGPPTWRGERSRPGWEPVETTGIALPATGIGRTTPAGNARTRDAAAVSLLRAIQRQQEHERRKAAR